MRRRAFLCTAGVTALAGCSNGDEDGSATATSTGSETGSAEFELVSVDAPEALGLNDITTITIGIRNVGSAPGTFASELETRVGDGEWEVAGELTMSLEPGERGAWESPRFSLEYLQTYRFRLAAVDETWSIEGRPRELDFNNYYRSPTGLLINVLGGSFESTYPTDETTTATPTDGTATPTDGTATPTNGTATVTPTTAPEGQVWAVIRVDVRNRLQEPQRAPPASTFTLEVGGESQPLRQSVTDDPYEERMLEGRRVRRDDLVYAVPAETEANDLRVIWADSLAGGDVRTIWTK
jgi:hypothetical protein